MEESRLRKRMEESSPENEIGETSLKKHIGEKSQRKQIREKSVRKRLASTEFVDSSDACHFDNKITRSVDSLENYWKSRKTEFSDTLATPSSSFKRRRLPLKTGQNARPIEKPSLVRSDLETERYSRRILRDLQKETDIVLDTSGDWRYSTGANFLREIVKKYPQITLGKVVEKFYSNGGQFLRRSGDHYSTVSNRSARLAVSMLRHEIFEEDMEAMDGLTVCKNKNGAANVFHKESKRIIPITQEQDLALSTKRDSGRDAVVADDTSDSSRVKILPCLKLQKVVEAVNECRVEPCVREIADHSSVKKPVGSNETSMLAEGSVANSSMEAHHPHRSGKQTDDFNLGTDLTFETGTRCSTVSKDILQANKRATSRETSVSKSCELLDDSLNSAAAHQPSLQPDDFEGKVMDLVSQTKEKMDPIECLERLDNVETESQPLDSSEIGQLASRRDTNNGRDIPSDLHYVVLGQCVKATRRYGNAIFRKMVKEFNDSYTASPFAIKKLVVERLIREIGKLDPPGKFVEFDSDGNFVDVPFARVKQKVSQAFRELRRFNRCRTIGDGKPGPKPKLKIPIGIDNAVVDKVKASSNSSKSSFLQVAECHDEAVATSRPSAKAPIVRFEGVPFVQETGIQFIDSQPSVSGNASPGECPDFFQYLKRNFISIQDVIIMAIRSFQLKMGSFIPVPSPLEECYGHYLTSKEPNRPLSKKELQCLLGLSLILGSNWEELIDREELTSTLTTVCPGRYVM